MIWLALFLVSCVLLAWAALRYRAEDWLMLYIAAVLAAAVIFTGTQAGVI